MPTRRPVHGKPQSQGAQHQATRSSTAKGYGYKWQKARELYLKAHPLCIQCKARGVVMAANVVDHIIPHRGDMTLFWDRKNWQPLCTTDHNKKTGKGE